VRPIALTRAVPPSIVDCELTHLGRAPIDLERAVEQHRRYEEALTALGCDVVRLPPLPRHADSVFVEDAAVVLPGAAVITRPGAASRRGEVESVAEALRPFRPCVTIEAPGTLDGGDVLHLGSTLFVGRSGRSNAEGIRQLASHAAADGLDVRPLTISGCLHLKTAVTRVGEHAVLLNPAWVDPAHFAGFERIEVDPGEPFAANALRLGAAVLHAAAYPRTRRKLERRGIAVHVVAVDELAKAEAGVTCCCVVVPPSDGADAIP
jgi:dimethylargininase